METIYRGYRIQWSDNHDCWICYDFARPKTNQSLSAIKTAIDAAERKDRKAASVEAYRIGSREIQSVTVVEYLGRARYRPGEEVAVMGESGSLATREKSRTHAHIEDLAPMTDEAEQAVERYRQALAALKVAEDAVNAARAEIPRMTKDHIAGLVAIYERNDTVASGGDDA